MSTVTDENFIVVQGWMINDLGLSGDELLIYAILYGLSQGGNISTKVDIEYLANWINQNEWITEQILISLEGQGFLDRINDSSGFFSYKVIR